MTEKDRMNTDNNGLDGNSRQEYRMSVWERVKTLCITEMGYWIILLIGRTLRWEVEGWQNLETVHRNGRRFVGVFWHNRIFMTSYFFRHRNIVAMISRNRDGEYIARVSRRLGFGPRATVVGQCLADGQPGLGRDNGRKRPAYVTRTAGFH